MKTIIPPIEIIPYQGIGIIPERVIGIPGTPIGIVLRETLCVLANHCLKLFASKSSVCGIKMIGYWFAATTATRNSFSFQKSKFLRHIRRRRSLNSVTVALVLSLP